MAAFVGKGPLPLMRNKRRGFATFEIFIVSPFILAIGLAVTFLLRWLLSTSHSATWIPTMVLGIPFFVAYGLIVPMIMYGAARERIRERKQS